ncbi:hypothetical protein CF319_g2044 [Tilletia indica]|nr:hypothetical protein CF319_g2044 [Tilletia indica]KAE8228652.1 hypothetical protein CF326_g6410 [Tilletia indica]
MPEIVDLNERRLQKNNRIKGIINGFDEDEIDLELAELLQDQDSHNHTDVSLARQYMSADLTIKLEQFYPTYQRLNAQLPKPFRTPQHVLDFDVVPAL